jgi:YfiH family protein
MSVIKPSWTVPSIAAFVTTTAEGNLALHAGETEQVARNRARLLEIERMPREPLWMSQVHGVDVLEIDTHQGEVPEADAAYTRATGEPLVVMVADCLPILVADADGQEVGVIHAGWRGLAAGIIERAVRKFDSDQLVAWIGPGIGPCHYEVDEEVRSRFETSVGFTDGRDRSHWMMDLAAIAEQQLIASGVSTIHKCGICTSCDERFYSHRADNRAGRFAAIIWKK